MRRQRRTSGSLAKTAALLFFIGLLIADGVVAFFLISQRLDSYFPSRPSVFLPVIQNDNPVGGPEVQASPSGPAATATETAAPKVKIYIVKSGDTLYQIAQDNDISVEDLVTANKLDDRDVIKEGQELIIPSSNSATPAPNSVTPSPGSSQTPYP